MFSVDESISRKCWKGRTERETCFKDSNHPRPDTLRPPGVPQAMCTLLVGSPIPSAWSSGEGWGLQPREMVW